MFSQVLRRSFGTSVLRQASSHGTRPGDTLPFRIDNPYRLTLVFTLFLGSAAGLPFYMLKLQLTK